MFYRWMPFAGIALAVAVATPAVAQEGAAAAADPAAITLPDLHVTPTAEDEKDFDKYFYFHRDGIDFATAYADLKECDGYARGLTGSLQGGYAMYGALGGAIADAIYGSAMRRQQRRINMRTCMGFKGYELFGLPKPIWVQFNFEEGNGEVEETRRQQYLMMQAKAASGPRPSAGAVKSFDSFGLIVPTSPTLAAIPKASAQINDKDPVVIDPRKAYIYFRNPMKSQVVLRRAVTAEEQAAWQASRAQALVKAKAKYERDLARYREAMKSYSPNPSLLPPEKPKPVSDEGFAYPPADADNYVSVRAGPQFSKAADEFGYLVAVEPGTYALYADVMPVGAGVAYCLCMGSVEFDARAGVVTDLGRFDLPRRKLVADPKIKPPLSQEMLTTPVLEVLPATGPLPDRLKSAQVVPAAFKASGKMDNRFGVMISRLAPIDGVLAYDRDKVIDLNTGH